MVFNHGEDFFNGYFPLLFGYIIYQRVEIFRNLLLGHDELCLAVALDYLCLARSLNLELENAIQMKVH